MNQDIPPAQPPDSRPRGYRSAADKRRFAIRTGILGAVFFFAQIIIPYAAMIAFTGSRMHKASRDADEFNMKQAAVWQEGLWFLSRLDYDTTELKSTQLRNPKDRPTTVASVSLRTSGAWLLPAEDRLWIISPQSVHYYKDGQVTQYEAKRSGGLLSRPFLYHGRPAALKDHGTRHTLVVLEDEQWQEKAYLTFKGEYDTVRPDKVEVVAIGNILHVFYSKFYQLYYQQWDPESPETESEEWKEIGLADISLTSITTGGWTSIRMGGRPAFFVLSDALAKSITGYRKGREDWPSFFVYDDDRYISDMTVYRSGQNEDFILVVQDILDSVQMIEVSDGVVSDEDRYLVESSISFRVWPVMFVAYTPQLLLPFILAVIISGLMRRHRTSSYAAGGKSVFFASLTRRAIAQMIDAVVLAAPMVVAYILMFRNIGRGSYSGIMLMFMPFVCALLWMLVVVLVFSFLEGRYGRTPGKWIAGICVLSTNLRPCGFGRALIRNLLKFVDGFFNFLVAVLVTALTENWQRVGDLAAGTIVVYSSTKSRVPSRAEDLSVQENGEGIS